MLPECAETIQDSIKFFQKLMSGEKIGLKKLLWSFFFFDMVILIASVITFLFWYILLSN